MFDTTNPDWVPTLKLGHDKIAINTSKATARYARSKERSTKKIKLEVLSNKQKTSDSYSDVDFNTENLEIYSNEINSQCISFSDTPMLSSTILNSNEKENETQTSNDLMDKSLQTDISNEYFASLEESYTEINHRLYTLQTENEMLKVGTKKWFNENDEKVLFYTGLPNFKVLQTVFDFLFAVVGENNRAVLSPFQEMVLTLMRLRLNLTLNDLSYRFNISRSTTSSIVLKWINIMFVRLRPLIMWPGREEIISTTPVSFRQYFKTKVAVIIDCFEIFINKPTNLKARNATWSQYKHHNTIKFLIGISPQGVITFISKAWGGRTSDKYLTENSKFLNNLLPGDVVLADRGFDIAESVGFYCAEVKIPAFTKGRKQLSGADVESTRRIASVRIHVERVIGLVRNKYTILQSILPLDYLIRKDGGYTTIDKIVTVCSALCNICNSVVPIE